MKLASGAVRSKAFGRSLWRTVYEPDGGSFPVTGAAVLLHGLGDHGGRYGEAVGPLVRRGIAVVAFDWPGHGRSPGRRGLAGDPRTVGDAALEVVADLRHSFPGKPLGMMAHSTGSLIALRLLQDRRYVPDFAWINAPLLDPVAGQPAWKAWLVGRLARWTPGLRIRTSVRREDCWRDDGGGDAVDSGGAPDPLRHGRVSLGFAAGLVREAASLRGGIDRFAGLGTRILLTQGLDDRICPPDRLRDFFEALPAPRKRIETFAGMLHEGFADLGREDLFRVVDEWLGEIGLFLIGGSRG